MKIDRKNLHQQANTPTVKLSHRFRKTSRLVPPAHSACESGPDAEKLRRMRCWSANVEEDLLTIISVLSQQSAQLSLQAGGAKLSKIEKQNKKNNNTKITVRQCFTALRLSPQGSADRSVPASWNWAPDCWGKWRRSPGCSAILRPATSTGCPGPRRRSGRAALPEIPCVSRQWCAASESGGRNREGLKPATSSYRTCEVGGGGGTKALTRSMWPAICWSTSSLGLKEPPCSSGGREKAR